MKEGDEAVPIRAVHLAVAGGVESKDGKSGYLRGGEGRLVEIQSQRSLLDVGLAVLGDGEFNHGALGGKVCDAFGQNVFGQIGRLAVGLVGGFVNVLGDDAEAVIPAPAIDGAVGG